MDWLQGAVTFVASLVWGPQTLVFLLGAGLFLTVRLRFVQVTAFPLSLRLLTGGRDIGEKKGEDRRGDVSPLQALAVSLAASVGNGNIAGVATAIAMGGPGAVFWMWLAAVFGMATKLAETVIGQSYRRIAPNGTVAGGPMVYIADALGWRRLAAAYAFFMGGKALFSTTLIQSNSMAVAVSSTIGLAPWITGLTIAVLVWLVIVGGIRTIARVSMLLTPIMVAFYLGGALVTLALFASRIPDAFSLIFVSAFDPSAAAGGVAGASVAAAMRYGMARGAYSNEAGNGTAAVFHAAAKTSAPVRQGLIASLDVFLDTIVICTLTSLAVLVTGAWETGTSTAMVAAGFEAALPRVGGLVVAASSLLFGLSSLIATPYYGEMSSVFLLGERTRVPFRWLYCTLCVAGAMLEVEIAWSFGDVFNGMMTITNVVAVLALSGVAARLVREYRSSA